MKLLRSFILIAVCCCAVAAPAQKRHLNDKVLNRPYADSRAWHLGFSVGMHTQNLQFTNSGYISEDGSQWVVEQPTYQPGFCVNGLIDLRLNNYFSVRFSPGLYFGSRSIVMYELNTEAEERQSLKTAYVVLPFDIKYAAKRLGNFRPYVVGGVMPAFDVSKKSSDFIQLKTFDTYLTVGFGFDFYLPYFKFIPEVKFCFGLPDVIQHNRPDLEDDPYKLQFTQAIKKATSKMIVLTFYFE